MKIKITKSEFIQGVKDEIEALKNTATQKELDRLDFNTFDPNHTRLCLYGQMTKGCLSNRSIKLIEKCCVRVVSSAYTESFNAIKSFINGPPKNLIKERREGDIIWYSSLEKYIVFNNAKNEHIIQYLKGEVETLSL